MIVFIQYGEANTVIKSIFILVIAASLSQIASANIKYQDNMANKNVYIQTARYSYEKIVAKEDQRDLLSVIVQLQFPQDIINVGNALNYLLIPSGYTLENPKLSDKSQYFLYGLSLPEIHRELGPITLKDALTLLGNRGFDLVINPVRRTVGFRLNTEYAQYLDDKVIERARVKWKKETNSTILMTDNDCHNIKKENELTKTIIKQYGPVKKNQSLSAIVRSLNPSVDQSKYNFEQCLVAFYQSNLSSFSRNNMNLLLEGTILTIPSAEYSRSISIAGARRIIQSHVVAWKALLSEGQ